MEGSTAHVPCPEGTHSNVTGLNNSDLCTACAAGTFCFAGSTEPTNCSAGTYAEEAERNLCDACPEGKYQGDEGSTACKECGDGFKCPKGSVVRIPASCDPGTYLDSSLDYPGFYRMALRMGDWKAIFNEEEVFWYEVPPDPFKVRARLVLSLLLLLVTTTATTTTPATRPLTPPTRALPLCATRSRSSPSRRPRASSTPRSSTSRPTRTSASTARPTSRT